MRIRHRVGLVLGLVVVVVGVLASLPPSSSAQDEPTLWFRVRRSVIVEPGQTWQAARPGSMQSLGGVTFTFEVSPTMAIVETLDDGAYSAVMVGCNDRARFRRSMLIVGQRHGPRKDVRAVMEVYCGPTAPAD